MEGQLYASSGKGGGGSKWRAICKLQAGEWGMREGRILEGLFARFKWGEWGGGRRFLNGGTVARFRAAIFIRRLCCLNVEK